MTAIRLYDAIARENRGAAAGADPRPGERVARLAERLVESSVADWERLRQYETEFTPAEWDAPGLASDITRSIYALFQAWAADAEQVLTRTRELAAAGRPVPNAEALEDAYGRTCARLKLTPEMIAGAVEQVRRGEFVPAGELRDELRTRLRA